ncbi:hypothetical protein PMAYCL1PPCAC_21201, partial [Pristionchus mayeri]
RMRELAKIVMSYPDRRRQRRVVLKVLQTDDALVFHSQTMYANTYRYFMAMRNCCSFCGTTETLVRYYNSYELDIKHIRSLSLALNQASVNLDNQKPLPSRLIGNLEQAVCRQTVAELMLRNIKIDANFMDLLERTECSIRNLEIYGVKVVRDCTKRFSSFIKSQNLDTLIVQNSMERQCRSKKVVEYLSSIRTIIYPSLIIKTEWLAELLEKRLQNEKYGVLRLGVTKIPVLSDFGVFSHLRFRNGLNVFTKIIAQILLFISP